MRPLPFTLRQLEVFASLCASGSFRRSAERLGISQASVSAQMDALELQLGQPLFVRRRGQPPVLTVAGRAFLGDLQAFKVAAETLAAYRQSHAQQSLAAHYRVLVGQGTLDRYIRPKLDGFFAAHPSIELTFETRARGDDLARDIAEGRYDLVLVHRLVTDAAEPELRRIALLRGGVYGHRKFVADRTLPLSVEQINELPFVLPTAYPPEHVMLEFYERHGIRPRQVAARTQHYDVVVAMVQRGLGVACLTDAIVRPGMGEDVVMLHPVENWRLMWYRKDAGADSRCDAVEAFLMASVLGDPNYRTLSEVTEA